MNAKNEILTNLKKDINELKQDLIPKFIFIGGLPGSGKSLMIDKVKKDFKNSQFAVIEADLYREYFKDKMYVEETVQEANFIEERLLKYSISNKKNVISISTLRNYEYLDNLIINSIKKAGYKVYFYILITNQVESIISTYDRYISDKQSNCMFPRLNKLDYLKVAYNGFLNSLNFFSNKSYFENSKFFIRGMNMNLPQPLIIDKTNILKSVWLEERRQINLMDIEILKGRIQKINLLLKESYELQEFNKIKKYLLTIIEGEDRNESNFKY